MERKKPSIYVKWLLMEAERWDPPRETHKTTSASTSRVSLQECQAGGADRALWKCFWETPGTERGLPGTEMGSGVFGRSWNLSSSENKGWDEGRP